MLNKLAFLSIWLALPLAAQTINPYQIRPATANGYVLTTPVANEPPSWQPASGGANECADAGALAYYAAIGTTISCDVNTNDDGNGNITAVSYATDQTFQGVELFGVGSGPITLPSGAPTSFIALAGPSSGGPIQLFLDFPAASPSGGQVLSCATPTTVNTRLHSACTWVSPGSFTAGGDLSGSSTSQEVIGLHSVPFCTGFSPTNGQVVEYTTASSPNPCYTTVTGSGGSYPTPVTVTVSTASSLALTSCITSSNTDYQIRLDNIQLSAAAVLYLQVSTNNGSTWDTSSTYLSAEYANSYSTSSAAPLQASSTSGFELVQGTGAATSATHTVNGSLTLTHPLSTTTYKTFQGLLNAPVGGNGFQLVDGGEYQNANAINAVQLIPASGTITGTATCQPLPQ
jgi:hypothetical protein